MNFSSADGTDSSLGFTHHLHMCMCLFRFFIPEVTYELCCWCKKSIAAFHYSLNTPPLTFHRHLLSGESLPPGQVENSSELCEIDFLRAEGASRQWWSLRAADPPLCSAVSHRLCCDISELLIYTIYKRDVCDWNKQKECLNKQSASVSDNIQIITVIMTKCNSTELLAWLGMDWHTRVWLNGRRQCELAWIVRFWALVRWITPHSMSLVVITPKTNVDQHFSFRYNAFRPHCIITGPLVIRSDVSKC